MNQVKPGYELPFEYSAFDLANNLFMAMKIYDLSGVSPVLVSTITMDHIVNGSYVGKFKPIAGKSYLINKMAYTDGTFVTPDLNRSPGSETIFAENLIYDEALDIEVEDNETLDVD